MLLVLLFAATLSSCRKMKEPEFRGISAIEVGKVNLTSTTVRLQIRYYNPNSFRGTLRWAEGKAWIDSTYLGPFRVDQEVQAAGKREFTIPVELKLGVKEALVFTAGLLGGRSSNREVLLRIEGKARAGRQGIFKTVPFKYQGYQSLDSLAIR